LADFRFSVPFVPVFSILQALHDLQADFLVPLLRSSISSGQFLFYSYGTPIGVEEVVNENVLRLAIKEQGLTILLVRLKQEFFRIYPVVHIDDKEIKAGGKPAGPVDGIVAKLVGENLPAGDIVYF
jgi:hypothetical protein